MSPGFNISFTARCYCKSGRIGLDREGFDSDATAVCPKCNGTDSQTSGFADELISVMADHPHLFRMALGLGTPMDKAIERAETHFRGLKEGWDDDNAKPVRWDTLAKAAAFLRYAEYHDHEIPVPDIVPVRDGSVDLEWHTKEYHVLLNFPESDERGPTYAWSVGEEGAEGYEEDKGYVGFAVKYALKPLLPKENA